MKETWRGKIARMSNGNIELNKKALVLKKSWDEVAGMLKAPQGGKKKK